jgi:hypothetical protein
LHRWVDAQPSGAAATWLALADALFRSSDAPVGKLRHGLLAPEGVRALIDEVAFRGLEDAPQKREALNVLPRLLVLAQERCDRDLVVHAVATMGRLAGPATAAGARESEAQAQAGVTSALSRASRYMCPQAGAHGERVWGEIAHPWRTASLPAELEGVYQRHRDPGFDAATGCADASIASSTSSSARAEPRAS